MTLRQRLTRQTKNYPMIRKDKIHTVLIGIAIFLYVYSYQIAFIFYDAKGLTGEQRQDVIHSYWNMRFGIYAIIILIAFYVAKQNLNKLQTALINIGLSFAIWSAFDKIVLNEYGQSKYDKLIMFVIIFFEIWKYKRKKRNENISNN